jgi:uncharacterized protein (DUF4415 family)
MDQTTKIRQMMANTKKIKITFCIDADSLEKLKNMASERGSKYQTLLNYMIRMNLANESTLEDRVNKLEDEINILKGKIKKAA